MRKLLLWLIIFSLWAAPADAAVVIKGEKGDWSLEVDGEPFEIKGVGCGLGRGASGEDYLKMAKDMGANVVRTWGTDQGTQEYLDRAAELGLKVIAGIWINYVGAKGECSYRYDKEYMAAKRREIADYVLRFKDHPAVLMWGVGNEAIFFTEDEAERAALCRFLDEMIREVHRLDPSHPVVYASAGFTELGYLADAVPSLDVVGINEYGGIRTAHGSWERHGFDKPYIFTEYGPHLSQDRPRDANGRATELMDYQKASLYEEMTEQIRSFRGYNLGGVVFHLGETTQESMTWWNLNQGGKKRPSYWVMYELYTGQRSPCVRLPDGQAGGPARQACVRLRKLRLDKGRVPPGGWVSATIQPIDEAQGAAVSYKVSTAREGVLQYFVNAWVPVDVEADGLTARIRMPAKKGVYRVYGFVEKEGCVASASGTVAVE